MSSTTSIGDMTPSRDSKPVRIALYCFFALLICYGLYEGWGMLYGPRIYIPEETVVVSEAYTLISGRAERITELRLNGARIPVTEAGEFAEAFLLAPGTNYLILEAFDARDRSTEQTLTILYDAPASAQPIAPSPVSTTAPATATPE